MVNPEFPFNERTMKVSGLVRVPDSSTCKDFGEIINVAKMGITVRYPFKSHGNVFDRICFYSFAWLNTLYGEGPKFKEDEVPFDVP